MSRARKKYGDTMSYESKLERVMDRLGADSYNFNWSRWDCFVEFTYNNQLYRFEHNTEKAKQRGLDIHFGSDCFAQVVLALESLARMSERGIYDLQVWIEGMKALPAPSKIPTCFRILGFDDMPTRSDVQSRYKTLVKTVHPDRGGDPQDFIAVKNAYSNALDYLGAVSNEGK